MKIIKLMIVDDHLLFRRGLIAILKSYPDIYIFGEAGNGSELLGKIEEVQPDVILMDLNMPVMDGIKATKALKEKYPAIKIIILSMHDDEQFILHLIEAGANGYLLKNAEPEEIIQAIRTVVEKGQYFDQKTSQALLNGLKHGKKQKISLENNFGLTNREKEVLKMICQEFTNAEISGQLHISVRTVEGHRSNLLAKSGTKNTAGLVAFAFKNKLVDIEIL